MPGAASEHQGHLGDLHTKSTGELMDLLKRQEKLLQKHNFLRSLPDGGRKVRAFAETLHRVITDRNRDTVHVSDLVESMDLDNAGSGAGRKSPPTDQADKTRSARPKSQFAMLRDQNTMTDETSVIKDVVPNVDLELQIGKMSVKDERDSRSGQPVDANLAQLINTANRDKVYLHDDHPRPERETVNSYLKVMQKSEEATANVKPHFRPNSSLKVKSLAELPQKYRGKGGVSKDMASSGESSSVQTTSPCARNPKTGRVMDVKDAESSAVIPKYKHDQVKVISLDESFQLQQDHALNQEELKARHAAERLAGKIHVKMGPYNPEADMAMAYRNRDDEEDDLDSDDNEEDYPD